MDRAGRIRLLLMVVGLLVVLTVAAYWPALWYGFVSYDDNDYVTQNLRVQAGLNWDNVRWAFRTFEAANWHPLTWLSHMLDVQLYGLRAGGHHLTNLLFHIANSLLLLALFHRMTGAFWRSALVAALFALHPLHVESVAWVAERKDVLSTCFFMLTLCAYVRFVEARALKSQTASPNAPARLPAKGTAHPARWYCLTWTLFALGLMSKPMLVTLPCVLLLLDYWPLQRLQGIPSARLGSASLRLVGEKAPFFALSAAASAITLAAQGGGGTVIAVADYGVWDRLCHAGTSYLQYLWKTIWPTPLAVFYPHPFLDRTEAWPRWQCVAALLVLLGISALVLQRLKRQPWLAVGWFWFLGTLVPVIGLVQVGSQALADRYTYLPLIGVFAGVAWSLPGRTASGSRATGPTAVAATPPARPLAPSLLPVRVLVCSLSVAAVLSCAWLTRHQVNYWRDDLQLFEHALSLTDKNAPAHAGVALSLARAGKYGLALAHCRAAIQADPSYTAASQVAADVYVLLGNDQRAITNYQTALHWKKASPWVWFKLAQLKAQLGDGAEAERDYRMALYYRPEFPGAHNNLGALLLTRGQRAEALEHFEQAARFSPQTPDYHYNVGTTLADGGQLAQSEAQLREAVRLSPTHLQARAALAGVLMQEGKTAEAQARLQELDRLCPDTPRAHFDVGNALLGSGLTNEAATAFASALRLEPRLAREALEAGKSFVAQGKFDAAAAGFLAVVHLQPENPEAHERLGLLLANRGRLDEAVSHLREALRLLEAGGHTGVAAQVPMLLEVRYNLGLTLAMQGKLAEAVANYQRVLEVAPNSAVTLNDLAWILATAPQAELRDGPQALRLAQRACELTHSRDPRFLDSLAAAYAETGRFTDATATAEKARELAVVARDRAQVQGIEAKLALYRDQKPFRQ